MAQEFKIWRAAPHVANASNANGFLWKFIFAYAVIGLAFYGLSVGINGPFYVTYFEMFAGGGMSDPEQLNPDMLAMNERFRVRIGLSYRFSLPVGLAFWACFDAAGQRRSMRAEPFALRIGTYEFMILGVGLLYWLCVMSAYIGGAILAGIIGLVLNSISTGGGGGQWLVEIVPILAILAMLSGMVWIGLRLSPAAAMTIRDGEFAFGKA